jgi:large subunit ribosomal protein L6
MSRIGKNPIEVPKEAKIKFNSPELVVEGPRGKQTHNIPDGISLEISDGKITLSRVSDARQYRSLHGLTRTLVANMVEGVTKGFKKELEIVGVGYKAEKSGKTLTLSVGYSNPVEFQEPEGIKIEVNKLIVSVDGIDKCLVGQTAARIRSVRKPDVYKGKGIRYVGEIVRKKVGKTGVK